MATRRIKAPSRRTSTVGRAGSPAIDGGAISGGDIAPPGPDELFYLIEVVENHPADAVPFRAATEETPSLKSPNRDTCELRNLRLAPVFALYCCAIRTYSRLHGSMEPRNYVGEST